MSVAIREYKCPICKKTEEKLVFDPKHPPTMICVHDGKQYSMDKVEFSVPAKRNPKYGEG